jgi:aromatic-L-amino-acid/L-tryptophan decarboxylase
VGLGHQDFRRYASDVTDWIVHYRQHVGPTPQTSAVTATVSDATTAAAEVVPVCSSVQPGYLIRSLPAEAPQTGESFDEIMHDVDEFILPGMTHWQSSRFFAYFKPHASYESVLAEMLSAGINQMGFSWVSSPVCTELETVTVNWLAKAMNLPSEFHTTFPDGAIDDPDSKVGGQLISDSKGGGVIQGSAGESAIVCMLAARSRLLASLKTPQDAKCANDVVSRAVVYTSDQTHCTVEKACKVVGINRLRQLKTTQDTNFALTATMLEHAMRDDLAQGLIPLFVCFTLATTSSGAIDPIASLAAVIRDSSIGATELNELNVSLSELIWIHVDAAWGGAFCLLPENQHHLHGIQFVDSICMNAHKQLLCTFDCCCLWVRETHWLQHALSLEPEKEEYLRNEFSESHSVIDYKDWQLPLGRRFRSLKLWFVMRSFGIAGLQAHLRQGVELAKYFVSLLQSDTRFELVTPRSFSLVCFRMVGSNDQNAKLLKHVNDNGVAFLIHTMLDGVYTLRLAIGGIGQQRDDINAVFSALQDAIVTIL